MLDAARLCGGLVRSAKGSVRFALSESSKSLFQPAWIRALIRQALDADTGNVPDDDGSPGEQMTVQEWRDALPGPLRTPGLPDEAVLRLAYLTFADDPGASPDLSDFEEWRSRRVAPNG